MAIELLDEDKEEGQAQSGGAVAPPPQAGQAPSQPAGAVNTTGQGTNTRATGRTGSGFVNLQNVLNANKNNKLGAVVGGGISNAGNQVGQGLQNSQTEFNEHTQKNRIGDQDAANRQGIINRITSYQAPVNTVGQGPNAQATSVPIINDQDINQFAQYRSGQYAGPQGLSNYDELSSQAAQAEQLGRSVTNPNGLNNLLQQFVSNKPTYSRGQRALDSLILGQTGAKDLRTGRQATLGLTNKLNSAQQVAGDVAQMEQGRSQNFANETMNLLGKKEGGGLIGDLYQSNIQEQAQKQAGADTAFNEFNQRLANKQLTQEDVNKYIQPLISDGSLNANTDLFGLTPADLQKAYNKRQYGLEDVTDATEFAKLQALNKLAGRNDLGLDASKIGKEGGPDIGIDGSQFGDYRSRQAALASELAKYQDIGAQSAYRTELMGGGINNLRNTLTGLSKNQYGRVSDDGGFIQSPEERAQKYQDYYNAFNSALSNPDLAFNPRAKAELQKMRDSYGAMGDAGFIAGQDVDSEGAAIDRSFGDANFDFNSRLGYNDISANSMAFNKIMDAVKRDKGAGGSIADLMNQETRAAFNAANPDALTKLKGQGRAGLYDDAKYNQEVAKYLNKDNPDIANRTNLLQELMTLGSNAGSAFGELFRPAGQVLSGIGGLFSDKNLKTDIKADKGTAKKFLDSVKPYSYKYKDQAHGKGQQLSVMAQDLEKTPIGRSAVENTPLGKKVHYERLNAIMLASQADLNERLKKLEKRKK